MQYICLYKGRGTRKEGKRKKKKRERKKEEEIKKKQVREKNKHTSQNMFPLLPDVIVALVHAAGWGPGVVGATSPLYPTPP